MRFADALRSISIPLLSLLSLLSSNGVSVDAAVFGETGVSNPQMTWTGGPKSCSNNNVVRFEWLISQTDSSMNGASHQPMAESGLPNVVLSFNHNILSVAQSAPSQSTTTISANQLFQNVVDDGPNVVQELTFDGGVTCANFMTAIVYSMSASCPATGTTAPALPFPIKGTVGFSATPVTVGSTGGTTNNGGTGTATQAPTKAPTTAPTQAANNNNNNNGGGAVSTAQNQVKLSGGLAGCFSGGGNAPASTIFQFMVSESNDGGKTFSQPMAENGLPTITVTFNAPVSSTGTVFNVANSQVAGKSWTFTLQDDQPNVGVGLTFAGVPCTNGQFASSVQYTVSAQLNGASWGVIGTGAKGFVAGNAPMAAPAPMPTSPPTPPTTAINKNTFGTNKVTNAVQTFTQSGNCWTSNGAVHAELLFNIAQTDSASPKTPHAPMAESGLPDVTITFGAPVTVSGTFNVANSASAGNSWKFTEQDDQAVIGGGFTFGAGIQCVNGQLQPFSFNIAAKANGVFLPTTSNSPGFKALGAENLLDDGSAAGGATLVDNTNNGGGSSVPIPIIAGAVAGVLVLTIATLLVIRHRRNKQAASPSAPPKVAWYVGNDTADNKV